MPAVYEDIFAEAGNKYVPVSCHIAREPNGGVYSFYAHWHEHIEVMLVIKGGFTINIGGSLTHAAPDDLVFINSRSVHSVRADDSDSEMLVLKFDPRIVVQAGDSTAEIKYVYPLLFSDVGVRGVFRAGEYEDRGLTAAMRSLERDFREKTYAYEVRLHMNSLRVFLWFLDEWRRRDGVIFGVERQARQGGAPPRRFDELFSYVERNPAAALTTGEAAKLCRMSYGYFCHTFRTTTGMTFSEYVNYSRITRAQQLLMTTDMNISETAAAVGYTDVNYFIRRFRERCGMSPGHFRRSFSEDRAPDDAPDSTPNGTSSGDV